MESLRRRTLLSTSVGAFATLAGCSAIPNDFSPRQSEPGRHHLEEIQILNETDRRRTVDLLVERNGTIVHWKTHAVPAPSAAGREAGMSGKALLIESTDWSNCGNRFRIQARLAGSQKWTRIDFPNQEVSEDERDDPHLVRVVISQEGTCRLSYCR